MPTHISLTGDAERQAKELKEKLGGSLPQIVRQAIKLYYDQQIQTPPPKS